MIIGTFLAKQSGLRNQRQDVLISKSDIAKLCFRAAVGIGRRKSLTAKAQHDQCGIYVGLKAKILMHIFDNFPAAADVPRRRVELELGGGLGTSLAGQPGGKIGKKMLVAPGEAITLVDGFDTVGNIEP